MRFGDFVYKLRINRKLTLSDLSHQGLEGKRWRAVEKNKTAPSTMEIIVVKRILRLNKNELNHFDCLLKFSGYVYPPPMIMKILSSSNSARQ
jgi:hypothetical protein